MFCCKAKTQTNLLLNGDFEDYSSCPTDVSNPSQPIKEIEKCIGWKAPTYGTSDYFNSCSSSPFVGIPNNLGGYQQAFSGDGYLGGYFTSYTSGFDTTNFWWEYVQGQFIQPLEASKVYSIKFYVSLAEYSDLLIKEFGAYISPNAISNPTPANLQVTPQLIFNFPNYFTDTLNWVPVEGIFIANGGEKYITIGNFKSNITTDTLRRYTISPAPLVTYFYIDAAEVIDITKEQPVPNIFTPNGDGINDFWKLPLGLIDYEVTIYNRWGNEIIKGDANGFIWNGKTKDNIMCSDGTYFYIIKNKSNGSNTIKGFLQLN